MATGELRGCLSLSEADAGSDTRNIACRAVRDGDEYVINGTKMWVTNGERAGIVALAARTDEGISCFIVEKEPGPTFGGITVSRNIGKLGYKGIETVEMTYDDHRVPADACSAIAGRGLGYILGALEVGRINIAARAVGVARAAFDAAIAYAQERHTMGKPIAEHQAIQMKLADMATKLEAARLLTKQRGRTQAGGRARRRRGRDGEALRERDRVRDRDRGAAHPRRRRLHDRAPGRALLPRRAADDHRRGHQRDPAARDRPRSARPRVRMRRVDRGLRRSSARCWHSRRVVAVDRRPPTNKPTRSRPRFSLDKAKPANLTADDAALSCGYLRRDLR